MSTIIQLDVDAIVDETIARSVLELIAGLPGFVPVKYDLNQRGSYRGWDLERAVVDLVTQRTQLFTVVAELGMALVATGKHGEPPTIALTFDIEEQQIRDLLGSLPVTEIRVED